MGPGSSPDRDALLAAIAAQERLRGRVSEEVVDASISALHRQLDLLEEDAPRRRRITVLFSDVTGYTAMSEAMDAELVAQLMNDLWRRLDDVVVSNGGRVDKHLGDALMAVWGAYATQEDDPEQAVRAGLHIQTAVEAFGTKVGRDLAVRVGVHTGPAMLSTVGSTREFTVMGDTVNVASRLEHACPPGGVLVSHDTYRTVRGVFDVTRLDPIVVRGKSDPIRAYLVRGEKVRAFRMPSRDFEGIETATAGREAEVGLLATLLDEVFATGCARAAVISGEAGLGKSRLLYEFDQVLELHPRSVCYFKARATRARQHARLGVLRDGIGARSGVTDADPPATVLDKLAAETSRVLSRTEAALLATWLGFDLSDLPEARVSGTSAAGVAQTLLLAYLRDLLDASPVVLLLEDAHWADSETLEVLELLSCELTDQPLLVVAATRPVDSTDRLVELLGPATKRIELSPLSIDAAESMVRDILRRVPEDPASIVDLVVRRCEGNPFFIEEFIKMLIDEHVISTAPLGDDWSLDLDRLDDSSIPSTLTGVLQTRLDALGAAPRRALQLASVVGRTFWDDAIRALGEDPPALQEAVAGELVFEQRMSSLAPATQYVFKHSLLHEVTYDTVLLADRPVLHARAAAWLSRIAGDRRDEFLEEIAHHLLEAGDAERAAATLFDAAARSLSLGDPGSARRLVEAGFSAMPGWSGADAHITLIEACRQSGDLPGATAAVDRGLEALASGDPAELARLYTAGFFVADSIGDRPRSSEFARRGLTLMEQGGGPIPARTLTAVAGAALNEGRISDALASARAAMHGADGSADHGDILEALKIAAVVVGHAGDLDEAVQLMQRALELAESRGNIDQLCLLQLNLGVIWCRLAGQSDDDTAYGHAVEAFESCLAYGRRTGQHVHESPAWTNLGEARLRLGDPAAALRSAERGLAAALRTGSRIAAILAVLVHSDALFALTGDARALHRIGMLAGRADLGRVRFDVDAVVDRLRAAHADLDAALAVGADLDLNDTVAEILAGSTDAL